MDMGMPSRGAKSTKSGSSQERRFSPVGAFTGLLIGVLPIGIAYAGGSAFMYVGLFFIPLPMFLAPVLALLCGTLPLWWPARSNGLLALMKFLALCSGLAFLAGGAVGLVIAMMFVLPIFVVGLFGIAMHMAFKPWDGRE